ncbi:general secretion pathway protein GspK [bacterium]|nr:general secretion pathway protein GspK [bacterium]
MSAPSVKKAQKGTIIIMVMWIIAILSLFAVGLGFRSTIELRLTSFYIDKMTASHIGQYIVYTVFFHIANDQDKKIDSYLDSWGNSAETFFETDIDGVKVTVSHPGESTYDEQVMLYGASDEMARININTVPTAILSSEYWQEEFAMDDELVEAIEHWRSKEKTGSKDLDSWYENTYDYKARHGEIQIIEELHFLKNFYTNSSEKNKKRARLKNIITVYGDGKVNMNTASREVLAALFAMQSEQKDMSDNDREDLIEEIIAYRNGEDGLPGTEDDQQFENANIETALETHESSKITMLNWLRTKQAIGVNSDFFRVEADIELKKIKRRVTAILSRSKKMAQEQNKKITDSTNVKVVDEKKDSEGERMRIIKYFEE